MTTQQPEALRLAWLLELAPEDGVEPQTSEDAAAELRRLHTENTALQQGYAAARLEIESLQAGIKTMAEEHADELMVAHLDGRVRAAQPAGVTDAELDELRQANSGRLNFVTLSEFRTIARAVLAKWGQPAQAAEPVAWLDPWTGTKVTTDYDAYGKHGIPLYTAPQPVAREPLTDEQIESLLWTHGYDPDDDRMVAILQAAHGIKGGQHGTE